MTGDSISAAYHSRTWETVVTIPSPTMEEDATGDTTGHGKHKARGAGSTENDDYFYPRQEQQGKEEHQFRVEPWIPPQRPLSSIDSFGSHYSPHGPTTTPSSEPLGLHRSLSTCSTSSSVAIVHRDVDYEEELESEIALRTQLALLYRRDSLMRSPALGYGGYGGYGYVSPSPVPGSPLPDIREHRSEHFTYAGPTPTSPPPLPLPSTQARDPDLRLAWLFAQGWRAQLTKSGDFVERSRWQWLLPTDGAEAAGEPDPDRAGIEVNARRRVRVVIAGEDALVTHPSGSRSRSGSRGRRKDPWGAMRATVVVSSGWQGEPPVLFHDGRGYGRMGGGASSKGSRPGPARRTSERVWRERERIWRREREAWEEEERARRKRERERERERGRAKVLRKKRMKVEA